MQELLRRAAVELAAMVRAGTVSARELTQAALERLGRWDPTLRAFAFVDAERALQHAATIGRGDPRPLAGVPFAVKDSVVQRGVPCAIGSRIFVVHLGHPPEHLLGGGKAPRQGS